MEKRIKRRISALVILGIFALVLYISATLAAQSWGSDVSSDTSYRIIIDNDHPTGDQDEVFAVWHDGTGGSELFRVQEDGKAGVGTNNPGARLHSLATSEQLRLGYDDSNYASFTVADDGDLSVVPTGSGQVIFYPTTDSTTFFQVYSSNVGTPILNVDTSNTRVGIGVSNPAAKLEIDGNILFNTGADRSISVEQPLLTNHDGYKLTVSSGNALYVSGTPTGYTGGDLVLHAGDGSGSGTSDGGDVYIYGGAPDGDRLPGDVILAHTGTTWRGTVGIRTANPDQSAALHVEGTIRVDNIIMADDGDGLSFNTDDSIPRMIIKDNGNIGIGTSLPDTPLEILKEGTVQSNTDIFSITNKACAYNMQNTETSILFNQWYWKLIPPGPAGKANSGRITVGTESDWNDCIGTKDSYMAFHTVRHDIDYERVRITSEGKVGIGTINPDKLLHLGDDTNNINGEMRFEASDGDVVDLGITTAQEFYITGGNIGIGTTNPSNNADLTLEGGVLCLKETTIPTADTNYGKIYTKNDNKLYFQDGAGNEHEIYIS